MKIYGIILVVLLAFFFEVLVDSRFRGHTATLLQNLKAVSAVLPSPDPGMDTSARYVRHLGLSTPGSAFPDYPGQPDYLPAGMMWPPPILFEGSPPQKPIFHPMESIRGGAE